MNYIQSLLDYDAPVLIECSGEHGERMLGVTIGFPAGERYLVAAIDDQTFQDFEEGNLSVRESFLDGSSGDWFIVRFDEDGGDQMSVEESGDPSMLWKYLPGPRLYVSPAKKREAEQRRPVVQSVEAYYAVQSMAPAASRTIGYKGRNLRLSRSKSSNTHPTPLKTVSA